MKTDNIPDDKHYLSDEETEDINESVVTLRHAWEKFRIRGISFGYEQDSGMWFISYNGDKLWDCLLPSDLYTSLQVLINYIQIKEAKHNGTQD